MTWKWAAIVVLVLFCLSLGVSLLVELAVHYNLLSFDYSHNISRILMYLLLVLVLLFAKRTFKIKFDFNKNTPQLKEVFVVLLIAVVYHYSSSLFVIRNLFEVIFYNAKAEIEYFHVEKNSQYYIYLIMTCVLTPILEEVFYRGVLLKQLLYRYSAFPAIFVSSTLFALVHVYNIEITFFFGVISALIFLYTNSLWLIVIYHSAYNTLVQLSDYFRLYDLYVLNEWYYALVVVLFISGLIGSLLVVKNRSINELLLLKEINKEKDLHVKK